MFVRPPAYQYKRGELHCERLAISALAQKFGTPLYVYSSSMIRERYRILDRAFHALPHTLCYSVKANSNLGFCAFWRSWGQDSTLFPEANWSGCVLPAGNP